MSFCAPWEESDVRAEAKIKVMWSQAKGCQQPPKYGKGKEWLSPRASRETANTELVTRYLTESGQIDFILQGSRTVRNLISLVLSHPFCGSLLCPLQEINTTSSQVLLSLITTDFLDSITIDFLDSTHCLLLPELILRLQNYYFPFCSVRLRGVCHCTHNFFGSSSGCYVIETMYISHQLSSQTNYFSSQNKYLSNGMPIKSSNYTLKKCSFQIH